MKTFIPTILILTAALVACGQQDTTQPITSTASTITRLDVLQGTPVVGQAHTVEVKAYDANDNEVPVQPDDLVWEVKNPEMLRMDNPGHFTPVKEGETMLTVRTKNGQAYTEYPEVIWQKRPSQPLSEATAQLSALTAPGHNYAELNTNWGNYVGHTVNLYGNYCTGDVADCGQCAGFAKAFGNQTPNTKTTQTWFSGGRVLTSGYWPTLNVSLTGGDAIATMEPYNGELRYSLADYSGPGHVALFASYTQSSTDVSVFVRDQNYVANYTVGAHSFFVPKVNGVPYCSTNTTISTWNDTGNICNYYKVAVR